MARLKTFFNFFLDKSSKPVTLLTSQTKQQASEVHYETKRNKTYKTIPSREQLVPLETLEERFDCLQNCEKKEF